MGSVGDGLKLPVAVGSYRSRQTWERKAAPPQAVLSCRRARSSAECLTFRGGNIHKPKAEQLLCFERGRYIRDA